MSRIDYVYDDGKWIDLEGPRKDIFFTPVSKKNTYFHIPNSEIVLRLPSEFTIGNKPLGEIINIHGEKIDDIPPFIHPAYRGDSNRYSCQLAWIQNCHNSIVSFVVYCPIIQDFRIKLDLKTMKYAPPEFGVR